MAPKRRLSINGKKTRSKRNPPTFTQEELVERAQQRAIMDRDLLSMSSIFQDPNYILTLQPLHKGPQPNLPTPISPVDTWCQCGQCICLPTVEECVCCKDVQNVIAKLEEENKLSCITKHHMFIDTCLNKDQLKICEMYRCFGNARLASMDNRAYRKASYRMFTMWVHGYLGPRNRRPIPACVVQTVREMFPEDNQIYMGFKESSDYCAADMADDI